MVNFIVDLSLFLMVVYFTVGFLHLAWALLSRHDWTPEFAKEVRSPSFLLLFLAYSPIYFFHRMTGRRS